MKILEKFETLHMLFLSVVEMKIIFEITQDCSHTNYLCYRHFFSQFSQIRKIRISRGNPAFGTKRKFSNLINRGRKFELTVLSYMGKIGVLTGPTNKIGIFRVWINHNRVRINHVPLQQQCG